MRKKIWHVLSHVTQKFTCQFPDYIGCQLDRLETFAGDCERKFYKKNLSMWLVLPQFFSQDAQKSKI